MLQEMSKKNCLGIVFPFPGSLCKSKKLGVSQPRRKSLVGTFSFSRGLFHSPPPAFSDPFQILGTGVEIFFEQKHNFLFFFWNSKMCILTQAVQKNDGIKNFTADHTMPTEEHVVNIVKFFEDHPAATALASHPDFSFFGRNRRSHESLPSKILIVSMQNYCQRFHLYEKT